MPTLNTILARSALLLGATAALCWPPLPAYAQHAISTPILQSDENFRDIAEIAGGAYGGTGYVNATSHNGVMRTGVFYRSEALSILNNQDLATVSSLHIGLDIDLRTPSEYNGTPSSLDPNNGPDRVPAGATLVHINIYGVNAASPLDISSVLAAENSMKSIYSDFVSDWGQRAQFRTVLLDLANEQSAALYHCSAGKDRTGWTSMLLQTIAGVPQATIMQDYLATNQYAAASIQQMKDANPGINPAIIQAAAGVEAQYLQTGLDQIASTFGTMNAYLMQGLGLTQADIYVLRAKMVYYSELPGQSGFSGNAAAGAVFLNALQNSPLSGHYTAYNYYLQSAIDAGTLWGGETRAGGQIHADAASYLMRQPLWIDDTISPYAAGRELRAGEGRVWVAGSANNFSSEGGAGIAGSSERSAGTVVGSTYRIDRQTSTNVGIGFNSGTVGSAGATASVNTALVTIGGRYGIPSLEAGPYAVARADAGWVNYQSKRPLGSGLGTASGNTSGAIYSGLAGAGYLMRMAPFTVTAQTGFRISGVALNGFSESGSELALAVNDTRNTSPSVLAGLDLTLDRRQLDSWTIAPSVSVAYERVLGNPQAESIGTLYGYTVSQYSAFDSRDLIKAGLGVAAQHDALIIEAKGNAVAGDGAKSTGVSGQLSFRCNF